MRRTGPNRIILSMALLLVGIAAAATPASAGSGVCPAGYTCIWDSSNYNGAYGQMCENNRNFSWNLSDGSSANNRASSVTANHTATCRSFLYDSTATKDGSYYGDYIFFFRAGATQGASRDPNLAVGTNGSGPHASENWSNRVSSNQYVSTGC